MCCVKKNKMESFEVQNISQKEQEIENIKRQINGLEQIVAEYETERRNTTSEQLKISIFNNIQIKENKIQELKKELQQLQQLQGNFILFIII